MDFAEILRGFRSDPAYRGQMVHVREEPPRPARFAQRRRGLSDRSRAALHALGIERLYTHQARALDLLDADRDVLVTTGTASGKSLCYVLPILEMLARGEGGGALLLFPTKALCQDQFQSFRRVLDAAGLTDVLAGVYDGDTPAHVRRRLRDHAAVLFSNPDMLHSGIMPQHGRWGRFLGALRWLVVDELHVYSGIFGANMANVLRRFGRLCRHYGSSPRFVGCSATIGNPGELAEVLTGRPVSVVLEDGSPRGRRTYVFWNPPRVRSGAWRSRRSANVEAHELMAMLVQHGVPTITFSKARMTAEMIHRYVCETLRVHAPHLAERVSPYRGGYLPEERREIERRLFNGELLGVSSTRALELGIDVGALDASILVGYPGTLASFFQQAGRAGRQDRDALVILVGIDTAVNQYVMSTPDYIFGRPVEEGVVDRDNPFVVIGHLRCAAHELPLPDAGADLFGPHARLALRVLEGNRKVRLVDGLWYHAASETPQHEVSLRDFAEANVVIEDVDTGAVLGEVDRFDAPPIVHPDAIYMHRGDTYRVLRLDLDRNIATVKRVEVDYYTQPLGGTDVHHVDHRLREKPFGTGTACWGEVTAYFRTSMYERIHFYSLDAVSRHALDLPTFVLETMAFWLVPPEGLMEQVRNAGLDAHAGLRGIGYATRMLLPAFMTCDTLDFSHSIGSANSEWNAIFVYERYPHGLGFTEKAFERLHEIMPAVLDAVRTCDCDDGCPCCVGKPLRQYTTWNVERGEGSIPSKAAARMILEGLLGDGTRLQMPARGALSDDEAAASSRLEQALGRRLERMREPAVFHAIEPRVATRYPDAEPREGLDRADAATRRQRRTEFHRDLRKRLAKHLGPDGLPPNAPKATPRPGMITDHGNRRPVDFPGRPRVQNEAAPEGAQAPIRLGDSLAARARKLTRRPPAGTPDAAAPSEDEQA